MILKHLETGPLAVNTYIVGDEQTKEAVVVDPGGHVPEILRALAEDDLSCKMIINTHTHWDHVGGNAELKKQTGAELITHPDEAAALGTTSVQASLFGMRVPESPPADRTIVEGDTLAIGQIEARIVELPGHSPCGLGLVLDGYVIVGDSLFAGSIGRTDFPGGSFEALIQNVREKLFTLPDDTIVLPGHGPSTTIGREKESNPFF